MVPAMRRNVGIVIVVVGLGLAWFIGFTSEGQGLGRDFIIWLQNVVGDR